MSETTEADRETARVAVNCHCPNAATDDHFGYCAGNYCDLETIAAALASERAKARNQLAEWQCPSCGATTRARMADQR
jgi:hypothetical protein